MRRYLVSICFLWLACSSVSAQSGGPVITTSSLPSGLVGTAYSGAMAATGGSLPYTWAIAQGALPAGLSLSSGTGVINGTPVSAGSFSFVVTLRDSQGVSAAPKTLSITVGALLTISTPALPVGSVGVPYLATLAASGGTAPYTWTANTAPPPGLVLDSFKGVISGTPSSATGSPFDVSITVKDSSVNNASPQQATQRFSIAISPSLTVTTTSLPNGGVGIPYSATLTASGGVPPYTNWTATGSLPAGLTLSSSGLISGTPTTPLGSPFYNFGVTVKDSAGNTSAPQQLTITIAAGATITTTSLPNGITGAPYTAKLVASGTLPFNWALAGLLPPGLSLDALTGVISGTPTTAAGSPFSFTVVVKDASGITSAAQTLSITITPGVNITTTALPSGTAGAAYSAQLAASGGVPPYANWTATGPLPPGLTLNPSTGLISGTPSTAFGSPFNFTVTVKDSQGNLSASRALSISIGLAATGNVPVVTKVVGLTNLISPGAIGFVSGTNLGPQASVLIDGVQNLVVYSRTDLVVFQISDRLQIGPAMLVVQRGGLGSDPFAITLSPYSPGIFTSANADDNFQSADGRPLPGSPGERVFFYATGLGTQTPPATPLLTIDGQAVRIASGSSLPLAIGDPSATAIQVPIYYFDIPFGLKPGNHAVAIQTGGFTSNIATLHTVSNGLVLSQTGLTFRAVAGQPAPPPQTFAVLSGSGALTFTASTSTLPEGLGWLSVTPAAGTAQAGLPGVPVQIQVNPSGLAAGIYFGLVNISSTDVTNSPKSVVVVLSVSAAGTNPGPGVSKTALLFTGTPGGVDPGAQTISLTNLAAQAISFTASIAAGPPSAFSVLPPSGNVTAGQPVSLTVKASAAGLAAGVYSGTLRIAFSDGTVKNVGLLFVVAAGGSNSTPSSVGSFVRATTSACTPKKLIPQIRQLEDNFSMSAGYPTPIEIDIVDECTTPMIAGTVKVKFSNGDPTLYPVNQHNGLWTVTWAAVNPRPSGITVTVEAQQQETNLQGTAQVTGGIQPNTAVPSVFQGGVVESASYSAAPAPGSLVSIFGGKLSGGTGSATQLPLSTLLLSTRVQVLGRELPLTFTSDGQVNAVLPYDLPVDTTLQLLVKNANAVSPGQEFILGATRPAVFTLDNSGKGQGHIYKVDSAGNQTLAGAGSPVKAGDVLVIYCSGLGAVDPPVAAGAAAPFSLTKTVNLVTVSVGGKTATVAFSGLTPGFTGLYQVNITVPDGLPDDDATPVVLTAAGQISTAVTISAHK